MTDKRDIFSFVSDGDTNSVRIELARDAAVDERNDLGWTPLHLVSAQGPDTEPEHATIAALLLAHGADVNARDIAGQCPLHLIAVSGSREAVPVCRVLLANGADPHAKNSFGLRPLTVWQHGAEIRELLERSTLHKNPE